ncbi:S41 family peptidase [Actinopolymorpha sp. B11F2]|uniref:S41 family peptidase n=1 Tax=Actinopolymorpha sp. B11F2 TaxID=3160862 RepID=UPI0032E49DE2
MAGDSARIERLTGLARVWGELYFYHPSLTVPDERWEDLLVAAIPRVEAAQTGEAYAAALNLLLRHLDDRWTRAVANNTSPTGRLRDDRAGEEVEAVRLPSARRLSGGLGYLDAGNADLTEQPDLLTRWGEAVDSLADTTGIVLDLRRAYPMGSATWVQSPLPEAFGFFVDSPLPTPGRLERVHHGWNEGRRSVYGSTWEHRSGGLLTPMRSAGPPVRARYASTDFDALPSYGGPLAVIVDDESFARCEVALAGLQSAGGTFVVHETADGPHVPAARAAGESLLLWGDVEVCLRHHRLATGHGLVDVTPDRIVSPSDPDAAVAAAAGLLHDGTPERLTGPPLVLPAPPAYEPDGTSPDLPSREARLLGLFKLWCVLGEFSPHLEYADLDWPRLLDEWVPRVEAAGTIATWGEVLLELTAHLNDSHVSVNHALREQVFVARSATHAPPIRLLALGDRVVVGEPLDGTESGSEDGHQLVPGMEVTQVDGRTLTDVAAEYAPLISASTPQARMARLSRVVLLGPAHSPAELTVSSGGHDRKVTVTRSRPAAQLSPPAHDQEAARWVEEFGYLDLATAESPAVVDAAFARFVDAPGLLLDMRGYPRCYPRGTVVPRLIDRPCHSPHYHFPLRSGARRGGGGGTTPGRDHVAEYWTQEHYLIHPDPDLHYGGEVAVLIDDRAISQSEDFCICLRNAGRGIFVGTPTAGTNGNVTWVDLPGGASVSFTGMRVTYADGSRFQNLGIHPDILVAPTPEGLAAGRDDVLEAAIAALRQSRLDVRP